MNLKTRIRKLEDESESKAGVRFLMVYPRNGESAEQAIEREKRTQGIRENECSVLFTIIH